VNILGIDGELMESGMLSCTIFSKETSSVETSVDGAYGNGGGGGWHMGASTVDGCDGRGSAGGWPMGETTKDAWNMKYGGCGWR
jgi:hypothetical protein